MDPRAQSSAHEEQLLPALAELKKGVFNTAAIMKALVKGQELAVRPQHEINAQAPVEPRQVIWEAHVARAANEVKDNEAPKRIQASLAAVQSNLDRLGSLGSKNAVQLQGLYISRFAPYKAEAQERITEGQALINQIDEYIKDAREKARQAAQGQQGKSPKSLFIELEKSLATLTSAIDKYGVNVEALLRLLETTKADSKKAADATAAGITYQPMMPGQQAPSS